jgi:multiple sugar transport system permease protein
MAAIAHQQTQDQQRTASRARLRRKLQEKVLPRVFIVAVCLLFILPFYWMTVISLKGNEELTRFPPTLYPHAPQWQNFWNSTQEFPFWRFARNTSIIAALTVLGAVISNPLIAYGFSRIEWPGRDKVFIVVLATVFVPFPVLIMALYDIWAKIGPWTQDNFGFTIGINTWWPLVLPWYFGNAFMIFLMRQFMLQIPKDLSDAARLDGANEFRIFSQIILPQCLPAIGVIAIFLSDASMYTLSIGLTFFQQQDSFEIKYNLLMAASVLVVLPVVALFLLFQKAFIGGISIGSLK